MGWAWSTLLWSLVMVSVAGARTAGTRTPLVAAAGAAGLFLINPIFFPHLELTLASAIVFGSTFAVACLYMEDWSGFMRSVVLTGLFWGGLCLGTPAVGWIALALLPWAGFNRRPAAAAMSVAAIVLGGVLLYTVSAGGLVLIRPHALGFWNTLRPLLFAHAGLARARALVHNWTSNLGGQRVASAMTRVTLSWSLLAWGLIGRRLQALLAYRRSDTLSFIALLAATAFGAALLHADASASRDALVLYVGLTAILVVAEISQRDYLFNRSARMTAGIGMVCGVVTALVMRRSGWAATVALVSSGALSLMLPWTRRLVARVRWRAVLVGCYVGGALGAGILSARQFT